MSAKYKDILARLPGRRLAVIGDSMLDRFLWGRVDRISPEAPVPVVRLEKRSPGPDYSQGQDPVRSR